MIPLVEVDGEPHVIMNDIVVQLGLGEHLHQLVDRAFEILGLQVKQETCWVEYHQQEQEFYIIPARRLNAWLALFPPALIGKHLVVADIIDEDGQMQEETISQKELYDLYLGELTAGIAVGLQTEQYHAAKYAVSTLWRTARSTLTSAIQTFLEYAENQGITYEEGTLQASILELELSLIGDAVMHPEKATALVQYGMALVEDVIARHLLNCVNEQDDPYQCLTRMDMEIIAMLHRISSGFLQIIEKW